jgi:2-isopropylmalate synthase
MKIDKVIVFDTTLRDGEQSAGFRLGVKQKLEIARQLAELNVDVIEAGYPISSPEDFKAVAMISEQIEGPVIAALSRAVSADIKECIKALAKAKHPRIHTGMGVSDFHILGKFKDDKYGRTIEEKKEHLYQMSVTAVRQAKKHVDDVHFFAEDAGRCDRDYLFRVLEGVIEAGANVVNIPDTTGYSVPEQYGALIAAIKENVPNINKATISVHCHDDLGMAVANTLAGVMNGARQVECTINGIGERAGNAALEEVVMALKTRRDYFGVETGIECRELSKSSQLVARAFGLAIPVNKAVVGTNAFAHSSGIHVDGFLKDRQTYEIMKPQDIGIKKSRIVLTARSGRHALHHRLEELGYKLSTEEIEKTYARFLTEADKIGVVTDRVLQAIVGDEVRETPDTYHLESVEVSISPGKGTSARVKIKVGSEVKQSSSSGDGPVDAIYQAIDELTNFHCELMDYSVKTTSSGENALGETTVKLRYDGIVFAGYGASTDILIASARAYLDGLNKVRQKSQGVNHAA